jgi:hypothetical protein
MLSIESFMAGIIGDKSFKEAFVVEAEELAAIKEDYGADEISAFRDAVKDTTSEFLDRFTTDKN